MADKQVTRTKYQYITPASRAAGRHRTTMYRALEARAYTGQANPLASFYDSYIDNLLQSAAQQGAAAAQEVTR